jgi:hypothetical protein
MLRITIEMFPFGNGEKKHTLSELTIINDGTGTPQKGNYLVACYSKNDPPINIKLKNYSRNKGHLQLLYECLGKILDEKRNK